MPMHTLDWLFYRDQ